MEKANEDRRTFIISRADAIGDVVLTLPVAGVLRALYPHSKIVFLGRSYTRDLIAACRHIDQFLNWDELKTLSKPEAVKILNATGADTILHILPNKDIARLAKQAGIRLRIGTTNRLWHWGTCNRLVRLSRRNSDYHESQLNLKLLRPLGAKPLYSLEEIETLYGVEPDAPIPAASKALLDDNRFNLLLHPKSRGHGREWGLDNFIALVGMLPLDRFNVFVTGTEAERPLLEPLLKAHPSIIDMTGRLSLAEFIHFIAASDGLLASGTGPLHVAAAVGVHAMGIFPPIRPIHPGRWAPIGKHAKVFVQQRSCATCKDTKDCQCILNVPPQEVYDYLLTLQKPGRMGDDSK